MGRTILDRSAKELGALTPAKQKKIDKILDRLNVPKGSTVQLNVGITKKSPPIHKWK